MADDGRGKNHGVVLEFTECSETPGTVVALLRPDGGWTGRPAVPRRGLPDASGDGSAVTFRTRNSGRVDGAALLLEDPGDRSFVLHVRPHGTTTAEPGSRQLR